MAKNAELDVCFCLYGFVHRCSPDIWTVWIGQYRPCSNERGEHTPFIPPSVGQVSCVTRRGQHGLSTTVLGEGLSVKRVGRPCKLDATLQAKLL